MGAFRLRVLGAFDSRLGGREYQEDRAVFLRHPQDASGLALVADGVGGHGGGDVASRTIADTAKEAWNAIGGRPRDPKEFLGQIVRVSHARIKQQAERRADVDPQSTIAIALMLDGMVHIAHVGDSRVYLIRHGAIDYVTRDHSVVEGLLYVGDITEAEAARHPSKGQLLQSVGGPRPPRISYEQRELMNGDTLVVCTDGIWDSVRNTDLLRLVSSRKPHGQSDIVDLTRIIADQAEGIGGKEGDNASVVVAVIDNLPHVPIEPLKRAPSEASAKAKEVADKITGAARDRVRGAGQVLKQIATAVAVLAASGMTAWLATVYLAKQRPAPDAPAPGAPAAAAPTTPLNNVATSPPPQKQSPQKQIAKPREVAKVNLSGQIEQLKISTDSPIPTIAAVLNDGSIDVLTFDGNKLAPLPRIASFLSAKGRRAFTVDRAGTVLGVLMPEGEVQIRSTWRDEAAFRVRLPPGDVTDIATDSLSGFAVAVGGRTLCLLVETKRADENLQQPAAWQAFSVETKDLTEAASPTGMACEPVLPKPPANCKSTPRAPECSTKDARRTSNQQRVPVNKRQAEKSIDTKQLTPAGFQIVRLLGGPPQGVTATSDTPLGNVLALTNEPAIRVLYRVRTQGGEGAPARDAIVLKTTIDRSELVKTGITAEDAAEARLFELPGREEIALIGKDATSIHLVDLKNKSVRVWITLENISPAAVAGRKGGGLVAGTAGGQILVYNAEGKLLGTFEASQKYITGVAATPDGTELFVADNGGTLSVWSLGELGK